MLLLKLLIVPCFLAAISLAAQRWGPQVGGLLAGFPVVSGPILYFLALEQGTSFGASAAQGSLLAVMAGVAFGSAYSHFSRRLDWPLTVVLGLMTWGAVALAVSYLPVGLAGAAGLTLLVLAVAPVLLPAEREPSLPAQPLPRVELVVRMAAGAALVLFVTALATAVGTRWAGLLAMFPVLGTVLGVFSHRRSGPIYVARLFRGMFRGFFSFATFCIALSLLLKQLPASGAMGVAVALALLVQAGVYWATAADRSSRPMPLRSTD